MGYRDFYNKDLAFLINEELRWNPLYIAERRAKSRLRMYANLFCRDMRKILINAQSECNICGKKDSLVIDHVIPISKGGKNVTSNVQVLCSKCNTLKSSKIN